ncbi:hypothetical protein D3C74_312750 [compost metagenome]
MQSGQTVFVRFYDTVKVRLYEVAMLTDCRFQIREDDPLASQFRCQTSKYRICITLNKQIALLRQID